jgi:hypothetical protein
MTKEQGIDLARERSRDGFVEGSGVTRIGEPETLRLACKRLWSGRRDGSCTKPDRYGMAGQPRPYNPCMARGWESKSVEDQISAKETAAGDPARLNAKTPEEIELEGNERACKWPERGRCVLQSASIRGIARIWREF